LATPPGCSAAAAAVAESLPTARAAYDRLVVSRAGIFFSYYSFPSLPPATVTDASAHSGFIQRARARAFAGFFYPLPPPLTTPPLSTVSVYYVRRRRASRTRTAVSPECSLSAAAPQPVFTVPSVK